MAPDEKDWKFYFDGLKGEECICGRRKQSMRAFCWLCYWKLPKHIRKDLFLRIGDGYEEAYEEAVSHLDV